MTSPALRAVTVGLRRVADEFGRLERLKLDGVGTGLAGDRDHLQGLGEFAIMVDADFCDNKGRMLWTDGAAVERDSGH